MNSQSASARDYFTAGALLERQASLQGDRPAIAWEGGSLSYAALGDAVNGLAAGFAGCGISTGTPVLLMLDNHADAIVAWLALARLGAVEVPVNTAYLGDILSHVVRSSSATVLIAEQSYLARFTPEILQSSRLATVIVRDDPEDGKAFPVLPLQTQSFAALMATPSAAAAMAARNDPRGIMAIMYTSGTTGASKGVMCSHAQALEYSRCVAEVLDLQLGDRYYNTLPLFHIAGQWAAVYACLIAGATVFLRPRFSVTAFWDDVRRHRCNVTLLLGAMANLLHRAPEGPADRDHPLDKVLVVPLFPEVGQFARRFGIRVTTNYGSTEVGVPLRAGFRRDGPPRLFHLANARSCGRVVSDRFEVRIVDDRDRELPPGVPGELVVRPKVPDITMAGYLGQPDKTVEAWRNLWLHSGDLMMRDRFGNFYFIDRLKDAIRRRGENISSIEVENAILKFAPVLECAVFPVPSLLTEQEVMAAVVAKPGHAVDPAALDTFLTSELPRFMVPRYYRVTEALPKTPTGKIQKFPLREEGLRAPHWDREAGG